MPAAVPEKISEWVYLENPTDTLTTGADGLFAACGVPKWTRLVITARRGPDMSRFVALMFLQSGVTDGAVNEQ